MSITAIVLGVALMQASAPAAAPAAAAPPTTQLVVKEGTSIVNGRSAPVFEVTANPGASILRARRGERVRIELINQTRLPIAMHPHGVILPSAQDGVPFVSQLPVPPGGSFVYDFVPVQAGTYFFHSHFGWELQDQMAIPFIIDPPAERSVREEAVPQEVVMSLSDFIFESPPKVFEGLRAGASATAAGGGMEGMKPTGGSKGTGTATGTGAGAGSGTGAGGDGAAAPTKPDLTDVAYDAVLANRRTIDWMESVRVAPGSTLRLRLINASSATNFRVDLGSLRGRVIAVDGEPIVPVESSLIELPIAQRADLLVALPTDFSSQAIVAQAEGTTLHAAIALRADGAPAPALPAQAVAPIGAIGTGYAQERSFRAENPLPKRPVDRVHRITLDGDMRAYRWGLAGMEWPKGPRLPVRQGERVELVFENRTMMSHPMHLHGHRFQVTEIDGSPIDGAVRDTVLVMPRSTVKVQFDADAPGLWMMHCHITWHEAAGMLGIVEYEGVPKPEWYLEKDTFNMPSSLPRP